MTKKRTQAILRCLDAAAALAATALAVLAGEGFRLRPALERTAILVPFALPAFLASAHYFGVHRRTRFSASVGEFWDVVKAAAFIAPFEAAAFAAAGDAPSALSLLISGPIFTVFFVAALNALARWGSHFLRVHVWGHESRRVVIVGVADLAELTYQNMRSCMEIAYHVAAWVDPDGTKFGARLHGSPVVSGLARLAPLLKMREVDEIVVAVDRSRRGRILDDVADALEGLERRPAVLVAPTIEEALRSPTRSRPRRVRPADLLNRRPIALDSDRIDRSLKGKTVLVSGAGGTIGGELARQILRHMPKRLILLENNATALFYGEMELRDGFPSANIRPVLGDVRDPVRLARLFEEEKPQIVFHAAAHKHVHQLEANIWEGVSNNLLGTLNIAKAADAAGAETFIFISTDKAVRPKSVMGATKRAAEILVSHMARASKTRFASVRFGNVLGSSGSVMKIFQAQIEAGRPLTITHADATRYFMAVEEAVGLVLQASTMAREGEIFVLNMGDPVRIMDMARRLIRLSGLEPERDVAIKIVGLRPGEKIAEELVEESAIQETSDHPDIRVILANEKHLDSMPGVIPIIEGMTPSTESDRLLETLGRLVPTFPVDSRIGFPDFGQDDARREEASSN
jgi:FlaA1/EpsC-like NDP-sugar epimerase